MDTNPSSANWQEGTSSSGTGTGGSHLALTINCSPDGTIEMQSGEFSFSTSSSTEASAMFEKLASYGQEQARG